MCETGQTLVFVTTIVVLQTPRWGRAGITLGTGNCMIFVTNITNDCEAGHRGNVSIHAKYASARE